MPILPDPKAGKHLKINNREVDFSFWPTKQIGSKRGVQSTIFTTNPWAVIRTTVIDNCSKPLHKQAIAFLDQAEEYFSSASENQAKVTKPVLFYYSFMNLAKCVILAKGISSDLNSAKHGISEKLGGGKRELVSGYMDLYQASIKHQNIYDLFCQAISGSGLNVKTSKIKVRYILPQILHGHRLWANSENCNELFINIKSIKFWHSKSKKSIWLSLYLDKSDISRMGLSVSEILKRSKLNKHYKHIKCDNDKLVKLESIEDIIYTHHPSDILTKVTDTLKPYLWANVTTIPPYRGYYLFCPTNKIKKYVLSQMASLYCSMYYLGSITRYRPKNFNEILDGKYGSLLHEIISSVPNQFIYLLASEISGKNLARGAFL